MNPLNLTDGYKVDHRRQYPEGTELVYSNFTPRKSRDPNIDGVVFFGLQYFIKKYLLEEFEIGFFMMNKDNVIPRYKRRIDNYLGKDAITFEHIEALHDLGYLPLEIKALPEGSYVPFKVPMFTIKNTLPDFFWLPNFFESLVSAVLWMPCTSATTAFRFRKLLTYYADLTGSDKLFTQYQGHDFSFRGMAGVEAAILSGAGHLLSFVGTDCIPAIDFLEEYYGADSDKEVIGVSVPATEHSVMCMGSEFGEFNTFKRLITEIYPKGILSIVSDTWDFWRVITEFLPQLKNTITTREGKVVIRPDSGDPLNILCGNPDALKDSPAQKGAVQCLWETFGGTTTEKGYKLLDEHIGLIYGDSITYDRAEAICKDLELKGFASTNVVFGIGSYTYQYVTRDTLGFAMKATYGVVKGEKRPISKDPKTDDGTKKSAVGLLSVVPNCTTGMTLLENVSEDLEQKGLLETVFLNGDLVKETTLAEIRKRVGVI